MSVSVCAQSIASQTATTLSAVGFRPDSTWTRRDALSSLTDSTLFDVVVVGGGIIGAAVALDAASRGLSVCLLEQNDFASGTSSKSTKLLHGGIRYLPHFQFGLIREGLLEQKVLSRTADYLFRPLEFALPLFKGRRMADLPRWASAPSLLPYTMRIGLSLYDLLGLRRGEDRHRRLSNAEILEMMPNLRDIGLNGGFAYQDAQTDDARLTISVLKTAVRRYGTVAASGVKVTSLQQDEHGYRIMGRDDVSDTTVELTGRAVVSATWAFRPPHLHGSERGPTTQLSKGVHLLYRGADIGLRSSAIVLPETDDDRVLFIVPWQGMALLGTTDTPFEGDPARTVAEEQDIEYLQRHLHRYLDVPDADPVSSFAGVRALINDGRSTAKASRAHTLISPAPGYTQVFGGKLTAYRPIAAEAVDTLMTHLGVDAPSPSATEMLIGAGVPDGLESGLSARLEPLGLRADYAPLLISRYGTEADRVVKLLESDPSLRDLLGSGDVTLAEVSYTVRQESVESVADFALRRTHLAWSVSDHARGDAESIAGIITRELGWGDLRRREAVVAYEQALVAAGL